MGFIKNIFAKWKQHSFDEDDFFEEKLWDEDYFWQEGRMDSEDDEYEEPRISP